MKKSFLFILFLLQFFPNFTFAQENLESEEGNVQEAIQEGIQEQAEGDEVVPDAPKIRPVIQSLELVRVNGNIIFDASSSIILEGDAPVVYRWDLGDGTVVEGQEVVHTYSTAKNYTVTLTITQGDQAESVSQEVFVYNKLALLLTDAKEWSEKIENLKKDAATEGTLLFVIESYNAATPFLVEEGLYDKLNDNIYALNTADSISLWTTQGNGINALTRLIQQNPEKEGKVLRDALAKKTLLVVTEENINTLGRILQGSFNIIQPKQIIISRQYELKNFILAPTPEDFLSNLKNSISDYKIINAETGKVGFWNSLSYLVSYMISEGFPSITLILLLMLPIIATLIAVLKQVIGMTTFGVYTPSIITLSFLYLGWQLGIIILLIVIISGAVMRRLLEHFNLLHIPRVAIILTISTLTILLTLALGVYFDLPGISKIAVFPVLMMITLGEKFVIALKGKGLYATFILLFETLLVSFLCYGVVQWSYLQNLMLGHPELILVLLIFNYGLGRWTGLRLMEYVRFREVMKHNEEE